MMVRVALSAVINGTPVHLEIGVTLKEEANIGDLFEAVEKKLGSGSHAWFRGAAEHFSRLLILINGDRLDDDVPLSHPLAEGDHVGIIDPLTGG